MKRRIRSGSRLRSGESRRSSGINRSAVAAVHLYLLQWGSDAFFLFAFALKQNYVLFFGVFCYFLFFIVFGEEKPKQHIFTSEIRFFSFVFVLLCFCFFYVFRGLSVIKGACSRQLGL